MIAKVKEYLAAKRQNKESKCFEKTKYGKKLKTFKDRHKGESCVIVGNGPSLTAEDLQTLHDHQIITFATNRVFNIFEKTDWRPTYYVSQDILLMEDIQQVIAEMPVQGRFVPINLKWSKGVDIPNADYFLIDYKSELKDTYRLSLDIPHPIRGRGTVTVTCLQLAIYMGFSKIYLIGVDHNFAKMYYNDGRVVEDNSIKNHFTDKYDEGIYDQGFHVDDATRAYMDVELLTRKLGTCKVYNATRGGKLEVYERVDFDTLFE